MKYLIATAFVLALGAALISWAGRAFENAQISTAGSAYIAALESK